MKPRSLHSPRRIASVAELAKYFEVHRNTMAKKISGYGQLDPYSLFSVLDFAAWYARKSKKRSL